MSFRSTSLALEWVQRCHRAVDRILYAFETKFSFSFPRC